MSLMHSISENRQSALLLWEIRASNEMLGAPIHAGTYDHKLHAGDFRIEILWDLHNAALRGDCTVDLSNWLF